MIVSVFDGARMGNRYAAVEASAFRERLRQLVARYRAATLSEWLDHDSNRNRDTYAVYCADDTVIGY